VSFEICAYLLARISRNNPNHEIDIDRDHGFTFIEFLDIIHLPVFFLLKTQRLGDWILSLSSDLLSWAQSIGVVPISGPCACVVRF
jgi:hypothetical protein